MESRRSRRWSSFLLALSLAGPLLSPLSLRGQGEDTGRIWGRIHTVSGEVHEGFIRWDRNEGSWVDILDGYKETTPFLFQDWWALAHPNDPGRDRVIELAGYRITWDDTEPDLPSSVDSGIRFGNISRLIRSDDDEALLELRGGARVVLSGGATDLGSDLRDVVVRPAGGREVSLGWEDLEFVEFSPAPPAAGPPSNRRIHGTLRISGGGEGVGGGRHIPSGAPPATEFTGYLAWDTDKIFNLETVEGEDRSGRRREIPFHRIASIRPLGHGARIGLTDGGEVHLSGTDDVSDGIAGIQISDPALGLVDVDWDELEEVRFHPPRDSMASVVFPGSRRLTGTVTTADSTLLRGWIRWDGDEEYAWELLDGRSGGVEYQVEMARIQTIEKHVRPVTTVNAGPGGVEVSHPLEDGSRVTLQDGRVLVLNGSNDVDESNHGVFVLPFDEGASPEDEEVEWIMVRWRDFLSVHFEGEDGP